MDLEQRVTEPACGLAVAVPGQGLRALDQGGERCACGAKARIDAVREHQRFAEQFDAKLRVLERERESLEEEKLHTSRYKQLLLKQRDIMVQLTARLNERDQSIMLLQEELDDYVSSFAYVLGRA